MKFTAYSVGTGIFVIAIIVSFIATYDFNYTTIREQINIKSTNLPWYLIIGFVVFNIISFFVFTYRDAEWSKKLTTGSRVKIMSGSRKGSFGIVVMQNNEIYESKRVEGLYDVCIVRIDGDKVNRCIKCKDLQLIKEV